jgi:hypothetical protein
MLNLVDGAIPALRLPPRNIPLTQCVPVLFKITGKKWILVKKYEVTLLSPRVD